MAGSKAVKPAPKGYYALMGLAIGLVIAGLGFATGISLILTIAGFLLLMGATTWYSKTAGKWVWGDMKGGESWPAWVLLGLSAAGLLLSLWSPTLPLTAICGVVVFLAWAVLGPMWDRVNLSRS